ncbi:MAG: hypothetical protein UV54_C0020G0004 [Candidatus Beckwithbacteria bacterium GW2011_GWA2_43_10]|uniref:PABS domain-containing protein n=1 Tax=Candidatus Beckwithbacteria bacterium GW2011_GWA2_43_10 TaxID=1618369 RepID=A0A0G1C350_9BACT|nr:MAG: hypothetical protein UV54_C0020G0004 [Candidatus Beckwithbacteria bacterium GW2011_GWA2_43_10]
MRQWLKNFLIPYPIKQYRSPINGLIEVIMTFNQPRLIIDGIVQSGGLLRKIWEKAIKIIKKTDHKINQVLIIGLGCGDCTFQVQKFFPDAQMTGVEIDAKVVEAAECYFNLATVKNLKIAVEEGGKFVEKLTLRKNKTKFDLVIIDAYLGKIMPRQFRTKKFFINLTKILTHNGVVVYNHLFFGEHKQKAKYFIKEMEKVFGRITLARTASNLLIFGWF